MSETNRIEYKREFNTDVDIEKEVIAFLNYHEGGLIYIGIDKQGKVLGVSDIDGDMLKIKDRIKNNISPSAMGLFDIVAETKEGKELIKIIVAGGTEKPYFKKKFGMTEKGCFIRTGTAAEPMPQAMIDKLFASRTRNSLGKIYSKNCFKFADSYLRLTFPATEQVTMQVTTQVTTQVEELIKVFTGEHTRQELQDKLNLANREHFRKNYLQ